MDHYKERQQKENHTMVPYSESSSVVRIPDKSTDWKRDMERRMERMEKTLDRAAEIMNNYFGDDSSQPNPKTFAKDTQKSSNKALKNSTVSNLKPLPASLPVKKSFTAPQSPPSECYYYYITDTMAPPPHPTAPEEIEDKGVHLTPHGKRIARNGFADEKNCQRRSASCSPRIFHYEQNGGTSICTTVTVNSVGGRVDVQVMPDGSTTISLET